MDGTLGTAGVDLSGGSLNGTGVIQANLDNAAAVSPSDQSPGTLTIQGNYVQESTGILNIGIVGDKPTSSNGLLAISGTASLDGTLNVSLDNGFVPGSGNVFLVLTSNQLSGAFATINGLTFAPGESLVPVYGSDDLELTFGAPAQSPPLASVTAVSSPRIWGLWARELLIPITVTFGEPVDGDGNGHAAAVGAECRQRLRRPPMPAPAATARRSPSTTRWRPAQSSLRPGLYGCGPGTQRRDDRRLV